MKRKLEANLVLLEPTENSVNESSKQSELYNINTYSD